MSTRISNPTLKALTVLSWLLASVSTGAFAQSAEETVLAVERAWLDAYEQNDVEAMRRIVADDFLITYANGIQLNKAQTIAQLRPAVGHDPNIRMFTENGSVRFFGDSLAVITGTFVFENNLRGQAPQSERSLYSDVYKVIDGRWQVISSHLSNRPAN